MENSAPQATPSTPPVSGQVSFQPSSSSPSRKKIISIVIILLLAVAIPPSIYFLGQRQEVRQRAAEVQVDPNAIASVYGKNITHADLATLDTEMPGKTDKEKLETLIERRILDEEARKTGVSVSDAEVSAELSKSNTTDFDLLRNFIKYQLLQDKVTKANVKYIEGYVIDFWLPPLDYPVKLSANKQAIVDQRRAQQPALLAAVTEKLTAGEEPMIVVKAMYTQYPIFQGSLGMNGKILTNDIADSELTEPYIYILSADRKKTALSDVMESMKEGEVKQVVPVDGSGGKVVKVTNINTATFSSFADWLQDKNTKYVKIYKQL